ncbi:glycosyltransferase family 39 protein [Patescibacteria group bacterium]
MPFIGDQATEFFSAKGMAEGSEIPILGINSSMPEFRQGPIYVWLLAILFSIFGYSPEITSYFAASVGIMAVGALYIFTRKLFGRRTSFIASGLLATSPLAVAHSQFSFIINPIPLVSVAYLVSLIEYTKRKKMTLLWPSIIFGLLFQFELASAPLFLLLPIAWKIKSKTKTSDMLSMLKGLIVGLLPQIVFDITNNFSQLTKFIAWVGYRVISFFGYKQEHTVSVEKLKNTLTIFQTYWQKFISWDSSLIFAIFIAILFSGAIIWAKRKTKFKSPSALVWAWLLILSVSYFIHGGPSEAYFPAFFIPLVLAFSWTLGQISQRASRTISIAMVAGIMAFNTIFLINTDIISKSVKRSEKSLPTAVWLPRYSEQTEAVSLIINNVESPIHLRALGPGSEFSSYLDNYRYLLALEEYEFSPTGAPVWVIRGEEAENPPFINMRSYKLDHVTISVPF